MLTCGAYEAAAFGITVTINDTEIFAPIQTAFGASFTKLDIFSVTEVQHATEKVCPRLARPKDSIQNK